MSLLARVKGLHLDKLARLRQVVPDYKSVHLAGLRSEAIGEFDGIHMGQKLFIEDKSARGLTILNPKTGLPAQTPQQWAERQLYEKTTGRIQALRIAKYTYPAGPPDIEQIRNFRRLHFRIDADTPAVRSAAGNAVKLLQAENPDWEITAQYGNN